MRVKYPSAGRLPAPEKPFSSVQVCRDNDDLYVIAQFLSDRLVDDAGKEIEVTDFGIALDGSASMRTFYGTELGTFGYSSPNMVEPVVKAMIDFLTSFTSAGAVELIYWAVGQQGNEIEEVGKISRDQLDTINIRPTKKMGRGSYLLPVVEYFVDNIFINSKWGMVIIITDGQIDDIEEIEKWSEKYAIEVGKGNRNLIKLTLIGFGNNVDANQLERLDNFESSVDVDIWSSKLASEMQDLYEIFDEVMSENYMVAPSAKIYDNNGVLLKAYNDGLPAKLHFHLNSDSTGFRLEVPNNPPIEQNLIEAIIILK